jgi:flagella basal body P-ring formation protein FlgA
VLNLQSKRTVSGVVIGRGQVAVTVATPRTEPAETASSLGAAQQAAPLAVANANPPAAPKAE